MHCWSGNGFNPPIEIRFARSSRLAVNPCSPAAQSSRKTGFGWKMGDAQYQCGGFLSYRGTPSHHPTLMGRSLIIPHKPSSYGGTSMPMETPQWMIFGHHVPHLFIVMGFSFTFVATYSYPAGWTLPWRAAMARWSRCSSALSISTAGWWISRGSSIEFTWIYYIHLDLLMIRFYIFLLFHCSNSTFSGSIFLGWSFISKRFAPTNPRFNDGENER